MINRSTPVASVSPARGASDPLSVLLAGRAVEARVSLALGGGLFRFTGAGGEIDLPLPQPLPPGTRVSISPQPGGGFQIMVLGKADRASSAGQAAPALPPLDLLVKPVRGEQALPPIGRNVPVAVIANPEPGTVRVRAPGGELDLPLPRPVPEGTVFRLTAQRGGAVQVHVPAQTNTEETFPAEGSVPIRVFTSKPAGAVPMLAPGEVVEGQVIASAPGGAVRVATRAGNFDLPIGQTVPPGAEARIAALADGTLVMTLRPEASAARPASAPILVPPGSSVPGAEPGSVIAARVITSIENGIVRLASPAGELELPLGRPLPAGAAVTITVQPSGGLVVMPDIAQSRTMPPTAAEAVQQAVRTAVARQDGMANLFADAEGVPARPDIAPAVRRAAEAVLDQRLPLADIVNPEQIARAIAASGLLAERNLASVVGQAGVPADLKLALFVLRAALGSWPDMRTHARSGPHVPPPQAGSAPAAQVPATRAADGVAVSLEQLLPRIASEADAALARITLHQIASLPEEVSGLARGGDAPDMRWSCEVPVNADGRTAIFGFVIERDGHREQERNDKRRWRVRAALDLHETGAVEADVRLSGDVVNAGLLVERSETAALLDAGLPILRDGLTAAGFDVEMLSVRIGKSVPQPAPPGHFMDLRS